MAITVVDVAVEGQLQAQRLTLGAEADGKYLLASEGDMKIHSKDVDLPAVLHFFFPIPNFL